MKTITLRNIFANVIFISMSTVCCWLFAAALVPIEIKITDITSLTRCNYCSVSRNVQSLSITAQLH